MSTINSIVAASCPTIIDDIMEYNIRMNNLQGKEMEGGGAMEEEEDEAVEDCSSSSIFVRMNFVLALVL